jgi:hypothetical protein
MTLVTALSLVACKGEQPKGPAGGEAPVEQPAGKTTDTAFALWEAASKGAEDAGALSFVMDFQTEMKGAGLDSAITLNMGGPVKIANSTDPSKLEMEIDLQMDMLGQDLSMKGWYRDGYYYFDMLGMKAKQPMSGEEAMKQNNTEMLTFTENAIKEQSVTDTADGGKKLSFLLDGAKMTALARSSMAGGMQGGGVDPEMLNIRMDDVDVTVILDRDGRLAECTYAFNATISGGSESDEMTMACTTSMTQISTGNVTITFPSDLDTYEEAPGSL